MGRGPSGYRDDTDVPKWVSIRTSWVGHDESTEDQQIAVTVAREDVRVDSVTDVRTGAHRPAGGHGARTDVGEDVPDDEGLGGPGETAARQHISG